MINHVWGSVVTVATNLKLLAAMPPLPGGLFPWKPTLEFDTTENRFREHLLAEPLDIQGQMARNGAVAIPQGPGPGVEPERAFIETYEVR